MSSALVPGYSPRPAMPVLLVLALLRHALKRIMYQHLPSHVRSAARRTYALAERTTPAAAGPAGRVSVTAAGPGTMASMDHGSGRRSGPSPRGATQTLAADHFAFSTAAS